MKSFKKAAYSATAAALMTMFSANSSAVVISASLNDPYNFNWSFNSNSAAGALTGTGTMNVSGFNSSALTFGITLNNTSALSSNRLTQFGFGIDPNATGVSFSDAADGGMVGAVMNNIPSLALIEICAFGGINCSGGANGGILGGGSDTFNLILAGTWGSQVDVNPIGFKYQTGSDSFEFTATPPGGTDQGVPEPGSLALLGLGLLGLAAARRKSAAV